MQVRKGAFVLLLVTTVIISACGASTPTPEAVMDQETLTAEPMMGQETPTAEPMMGEEMSPTEAMMETESPTAEPMMGEETPTAEPIMGEEMSPTEAMTGTEAAEPMMGEETPTAEPMMGEEMSPTEAMTGTEAAEPMMGEETPTAESMMGEEMSPAEVMTGTESATAEPMMGEETPTAEPMMGEETPTPEAMMGPSWFNAGLTDVNTGESFKVADFHGKVVLVETMAVWCSTCFRQQKEVQALHELLGMRDDLVSLGLDIDPNETAGTLKAYTNKNGFDWVYAVAPVDVAREIGHLYGDQFLNPPSAPMLIIDRQGQAHPLPFGVKSAQALQEALASYLN